MKDIKIKEYNQSYLNGINQFILEGRNYIPSIKNSKHILLLLQEETIIGIGSICTNSNHPYRTYISVYISPDRRNLGLGTLLLNELSRRYNLGKFQTAFDSDNIEAVNFSLKSGFKLSRQTYCYEVDRGTLKPFESSIKVEVVSMNNLRKSQLGDVITLQYEDYKLNHQKINPLNESIRIYDWEKVICEGLEKENSYVLIKGENIIAYLFAYRIDEESIEIGYTGNRCKSIQEYQNFLYLVMIELFKSYEKIDLEIDDCDRSANILGELFDYKPTLSWDTYIKGEI